MSEASKHRVINSLIEVWLPSESLVILLKLLKVGVILIILLQLLQQLHPLSLQLVLTQLPLLN